MKQYDGGVRWVPGLPIEDALSVHDHVVVDGPGRPSGLWSLIACRSRRLVRPGRPRALDLFMRLRAAAQCSRGS